MLCRAIVGGCLIASMLGGTTLLAGPGAAPLAAAVQQMDRGAIRTLLAQSIDVNAPQPDGTTALHWAAYHDDLELVTRLLAAHANVRVANRYGVTPLSVACLNGNAAMIERLLD